VDQGTEPIAAKLQAEIGELQRLLANHHRMQVEFRAIAIQQRFEFPLQAALEQRGSRGRDSRNTRAAGSTAEIGFGRI
jgi:hypothetical protein